VGSHFTYNKNQTHYHNTKSVPKVSHISFSASHYFVFFLHLKHMGFMLAPEPIIYCSPVWRHSLLHSSLSFQAFVSTKILLLTEANPLKSSSLPPPHHHPLS
jgi:hypothetical protein